MWHEIHPKLGISLMDHLFNRMDGAYPSRWKAQFPSEQAIANWREAWSEAFEEEGVTTQMISDAIRACRKKLDWPPSLAEFLKLCKPPINVDAAVYEAIDQMRARQHGKDEWSDPAIFWAAAKVGVPALAAPGAAESTREYGRQRLDELNASDVIKNISKGGNIEWARRIIEEEKQHGKVPLNKLNIARQAIFNVTGKHA
jgi:hypothetical protein